MPKSARLTRMPWGAGSVVGPDDQGWWRLRISLRSDAAGKRHRIERRVRAANKRAALAELDRLREQYSLGKGRDAGAHPHLHAYLESWLHRKREKLSAKTIDNYRICISHIVPVLGHLRIDLIEHVHITLLIDRMREQGCGDRTIQASYDALRACLNYAVRSDRILVSSPMRGVPRPSHYYEMKYYSVEEARQFLSAVAEDRLRALFHLTIAVGLRRGEVLGLKWGDVDFPGAALYVRRALSDAGTMKSTKTKRSQRRIVLPSWIVDELRAHRERLRAEGLSTCELVFPSRSGAPIDPDDMYYRHFLPAMQRVGLRRIRFHDLRHTAAMIRLAAGDNAKVVQEMLGHTKIETTLGVYGHVIPSMQDDSAELCQRIMAPEKESSSNNAQNIK